jgi:hypothetical protein
LNAASAVAVAVVVVDFEAAADTFAWTPRLPIGIREYHRRLLRDSRPRSKAAPWESMASLCRLLLLCHLVVLVVNHFVCSCWSSVVVVVGCCTVVVVVVVVVVYNVVASPLVVLVLLIINIQVSLDVGRQATLTNDYNVRCLHQADGYCSSVKST